MKKYQIGLGALALGLASLTGCATVKPKPDIQPKINKTTVEIGTNGYNVIGGEVDWPNLLYYYRNDEKEKYTNLMLCNLKEDGTFDGMKFSMLTFYDDNIDGLIDKIRLDGTIYNPTKADFDTFIKECTYDNFKFSSIEFRRRNGTIGYIVYEVYYKKETGPKEKFDKAQKWLKDYQKVLGIDKVHKEWEEKHNK